MEPDLPISDPKQDRLKRDRFVDAVAKHINSYKGKDCITFGIYGKWGSGKTSIINLIRKQLEAKPYYHFTITFTPWIYKSEEMLLHDLFVQIIKGCKSDKELKGKINKLGKTLKKYSQFISLPKLNLFGAEIDTSDTVKKLGEGIGETLDKEETIEDYRDKINKILNELAIPLIIFIDDIDRLERIELQRIFKIVKLTVNFSNIRYVLSYDEDFVAKSVGLIYGDGTVNEGKKFLEKIIQVPLKIPETDGNSRLDYSLCLLHEWKVKNHIEWDLDRYPSFLKVFGRMHDSLITTPRHSKRLVNVVSFSELSLHDEINPLDLILIEAVRLHIPLLFQIIADKRSLFINHYVKFSDFDWEEVDIRAILEEHPGHDNLKQLKDELKITEDIFETVGQIIRFLFPNNSFFNTEKEKGKVRKQGIGEYQYLIKYLEFRIGEGEIPDKKFNECLAEINVKSFNEIENSITLLCGYTNESVYGKLVNNSEKLSDIGRSNLAKMVMTIPFFYKKDANTFLFSNPQAVFTNTLLNGITNEGSRFETIRFIIDNCENKQLVAYFIIHCLYGYPKSDNEDYLKITPSERVKEEIIHFVDNVIASPIEEVFVDVRHQKNNRLFNIICEFNQAGALQQKLIDFITASPENVLVYMKSLINMDYYGYKSVFGDHIPDNNFSFVEAWVERDVIKNTLINLFPELLNSPNEYFEDEDRKIAKQYLQYVTRKETGRAN